MVLVKLFLFLLGYILVGGYLLFWKVFGFIEKRGGKGKDWMDYVIKINFIMSEVE